MAHGREGPDIVMNTRYAGASEVRAVSVHEKKRTPDGVSAIDPERKHLNKVVIGPATQQEALEGLWASGVAAPAKQSESPYVQMVISAGPSFFRPDGQGPGQWDESRLQAWRVKTEQWLKDEYGADLVHLSLHLDEDTPHYHALIVPTYEKRPRVPGKRKRGETEEAFKARRKAAQDAFGVRAAGRSSCEQWARPYARMHARKSYHRAVQSLGLGYGRDFVEEGLPPPEHRTTGQWVREQAAEAKVSKEEAKASKEETTAFMEETKALRKATADKLKETLDNLNAEKAAFQAERSAARAEIEEDRKEVRGYRRHFLSLLDQAADFLRMPNLPDAVRKAGAALFTAAGRPVPQPVQKAEGGTGMRHLKRLTAHSQQSPVSALPEQSAPETDGDRLSM